VLHLLVLPSEGHPCHTHLCLLSGSVTDCVATCLGKARHREIYINAGKTKILDNVRRTNVQDGEAGGITQQIGATYVPGPNIRSRTEALRKGREFELKVPGLLIIDTPGLHLFREASTSNAAVVQPLFTAGTCLATVFG
jgi:hypothetical protein